MVYGLSTRLMAVYDVKYTTIPEKYFIKVESLMRWSEESRQKPSEDFPNQEKNQYEIAN